MFSKIRNGLSGKRRHKADLQHTYRDFSILLPAEHTLPVYQKLHPHYDRFLPHLVKYIGGKPTIVDVGANCGDSLAAMVEHNSGAKYVCIEPDDLFYRYLLANIERIRQAVPGLDVSAVKALAGESVSNASLEGSGGTRHAVAGSGKQSSRSLDAILSELAAPPVRLLKSDVDGFDYDVLNSAQCLLVAQQPLLFFECQYDFDHQRKGYIKTIGWLRSIGYQDWTVFDNFGEVMLRTGDVGQLAQLMDYVWRQNRKTATRTIYYYDLLAAAGPDIKLVDEVLKAY